MGRKLTIAVIGDAPDAHNASASLSELDFKVQNNDITGVDAAVLFQTPARDLPEHLLHITVGEAVSGSASANLPDGAHPIQIASRLRALIRLSVLEKTAALRVSSAHDVAAPPPPVSLSEEDSTILFVGAPGPSFMRLQFAMSKSGIQTIAAFSTFNAFDYLHERAFDAVILNTRPDPDMAHTVCSAMRRNTRLYHTPAILLTDQVHYPGADEAFARGASDIIYDNTGEDEMRIRVLALAEERRRRRFAKAQLEACRMPSLLDTASDLYNENFTRKHLTDLVRTSHDAGQKLSYVILNVSAPDTIDRPHFEKALDQFAGMLRHCVRAEDFATRLSVDRFLIALPHTGHDNAEWVSNRVTAIAECTAYESADPLKPFRLELKPVIEEAGDVLNVDGLIDRLIHRSNVVTLNSVLTG